MGEHDRTRRDVGRPFAVRDDGAPEVAGYLINHLIGRGGMGVVWHATELRLDREVALKVHAAESSSVTAMWAEARLAAKVGDPGVVTVLDVGHTLDGRPYYTMEFVEGTDLHTLLRDGRLAPAEALRFGSEITRAVAAAHAKGIVHRDLKPRNVMIDQERRARVLDFGLAFQIIAGVDSSIRAGTPPYMSPEQVEAAEVGPPSDVYSLGVILFEMLTGRLPFVADDEASLFARIRSEAAPAPSSIAPVHPDIETIVLRCLAKSPAARFPSALGLLEAIDAVREGRPPPELVATYSHEPTVSAGPRPGRPSRSEATRTFRWTWTLKSSPSALWPVVSDTDAFNEAVGLGTVEVPQGRESRDSLARPGTGRAAGVKLRWSEYPFEWIKDREHSVFRWYGEGPLEALWNRVELSPRADGGTDLHHEISLIPRGVFGRVAAAVEIGQRLRRAIDREYRHIDAVLAGGGAGDPFDRTLVPSPSQIAIVEKAASALAAAGFSPTAIAALARVLLHAPARKLVRMRPFALAAEMGVPRETALTLMLHAARHGLLELAWDVVCPTCLVAHETERHLETVKGKARCEACETEYARDLGTSVELVFRPHSDVRPTKLEMYCAGSPARRPHIVAQLVLEPGERRVVTLALRRGDYQVGVFGLDGTAELSVSSVGHAGNGDVVVGEHAISLYPPVLREGDATLRLVNNTPDERVVRIETRAARADAVPAVLALTNPTFRDYFANELLGHGELVGVNHLFFLATDASDRGSLFVDRGDAEACASLRTFEARFATAVRAHGGATIPGTLETMVAAFPSGAPALRAAVELLRSTKDLPVRLAIHGGSCLALTRELRIEYFGETLHRTLWCATSAEANELVLSQAAAGDREVSKALRETGVEARVETATAGPYQGRRVTRVRLPRATTA